MARDLMIDTNTMDVIIPFQYITGKAELEQSLIIRLMMPQGTYYDENVGMDWNWIINGFNQQEGRIAIEDALKQDERVLNVNDVSITQSGTQLNVTCSVATTLGTIDFSKEVNANATN